MIICTYTYDYEINLPFEFILKIIDIVKMGNNSHAYGSVLVSNNIYYFSISTLWSFDNTIQSVDYTLQTVDYTRQTVDYILPL